MTVPVGVLVSGSGSNLQALLDRAARPGCPYRVAVVVSNRPRVRALARAEAAGVPAHVLPARRHPDRAAHEAAIAEVLRAAGARWVVLAGYMRLVGPTLLDAWPDRILNVHPALLPAFPGLHAPAQALAHGVRIAGATVHLVDAGTDTGPIVAQGAVPVLPGDDPDALHARIRRVEHRLLPEVVAWAAEGRLRVEGRRVHVDLPPGASTWTWMP